MFHILYFSMMSAIAMCRTLLTGVGILSIFQTKYPYSFKFVLLQRLENIINAKYI